MEQKMKKIGFIDYYISEWHANNYPAWMQEKCEELGVEYKVAYAWAELDVSPRDNVTTDEWCAKFGVEKCASIEEVCQKSDVVLILCPSDPQKHLEYAKVVLPFKKRTYIDKTFAPDYETACKIFEVAEQHGTPFFSTSALRFAEELAKVEKPETMITTGGGRDIGEYIVHQCEMVVKKMGKDIKKVIANVQGTQTFIDVHFDSGKQATMIFGSAMPFNMYMSDGKGAEAWSGVSSPFFKNLIADILRFYETGDVSFDVQETKAVIKLVEMATKAAKAPCSWIEA